ncbi:glycosyltransferase family 2 protein [Patescibacteria group bacterium]|nr:MAG: glycosyltransferase family 2 protein [Patescibacteria group bacterium]
MTPDISIIIVSWNIRSALQKNLQGLFALPGHIPFEVLVIDNGSHDGTPSMIRQEFPKVDLIQNEHNRGFAYACNQGLRRARGRVFVLFNPDMLMGEGVLEHAYGTLMRRQDIGVLGVRLVRPDGTLVESVRRDPRLFDQLAILLKLPHLFPQVLNRYLAKDFDYTHSAEVEQVRGSFFAFRRDVYGRIGELDAQNFFIWFEEVDLCRRVREAGWKIWYSAEVSCVDLVGQAFSQQSMRLKQTRLSKSMANYFLKWHGVPQAAIIFALRPYVIGVAAIADLCRFRSSKWK